MANVAVQTTYTTGMRPALAGMPASMHGYNGDTKICETVAGIGFGLACSRGTADRGAIIGGAAFVGVTVRDITLVHAVADLDKYVRYENMGLMVYGDIWVSVGAAVTPATAVVFSATTGQFALAGTSLANAKYMTTQATIGGLAILRILPT